MRRDVFDDAILRSTQFEQLLLVGLLGPFLCQPLQVALDLVALGVQLPAVVGPDLKQALLRLGDRRARRLDDMVLRLQLLFLLDTLAPLVGGHQGAREPVLHQPFERGVLIAIVRQNLDQLGPHLHCGSQVASGALQRGVLGGQRCLQRDSVGMKLSLDLGEQPGRICGQGLELPLGQLRVDPAQSHRLAPLILFECLAIGFRCHGVHAHQDLPQSNSLAFLDEDLAHDARIRGLDDLEKALRDELAVGHRDHVELADQRPSQQRT